MRAIVTDDAGGPELLRLAELPDPTPSPGEVLIEVVASGVNRADLLQRQGHYPPPPGASAIIGLEVSGRVAGLGPGVDGWTVGQRVVALLAGGGYAELAVAPSGQVLPAPDGVDLVTAAGLIEVAATVTANLGRVGLRPGETVLIHGGAGGIGTFAVQYARALGCRVLTTAGSPEKLALCRELGADVALDYHQDWAAAVLGATAQHGADVILDVVGARYLAPNLAALAQDGRVAVIGLQGGRTGSLDLSALMAKRGLISAASLRARPAEQKAAICADVHRQVWPMLVDGRIRPVPETRFPAANAADAHRHLESGRAVGKVLLTWH